MHARRLLWAAPAVLMGTWAAACAGTARTGEPRAAPVPVTGTVDDAAPAVSAPAPAFPARNRPDVSGRLGAVVSDHPLASAAGYEVLAAGGNAVDAAVTMAAVLAVVRPHMNGVGGDAFALFYEGETRRVTALNASGRAGARATPEFFTGRGMNAVPNAGAASVTVPGALSGWAAALERYGTITLAQALAPAIRHAEEGWPVTSTLERDVAGAVRGLNDGGRAIFAPGGSLPPAGAVLANPALARTLRAIAADGPGALYGGTIGEALVRFLDAEGGHLTLADFERHAADWVEPISAAVGANRVYAVPPNSQGLAQLQQLVMATHLPLGELGHNSAEYLHTLVELKKLAFADRDRWVADAGVAPAPLDRLLDPAYLAERARRVGPRAARQVGPGIGADPDTAERGDDGAASDSGAGGDRGGGDAPGDGDTVYLMAVDRWGNAVSWIQSLFSSFGSRLVEPETGIVLQNRGAGFTLDHGHPNVVAPGKRPFHTLTPMLATDGAGRLRVTIGTPGGHGQTQFLAQVYQNLFTFGMSPQEAVEAPRFLSGSGVALSVEDRVGEAAIDGLVARGHDVQPVDGWTATLGGVQVILVDPETGVLRTGADPRREAYGIAY